MWPILNHGSVVEVSVLPFCTNKARISEEQPSSMSVCGVS